MTPEGPHRDPSSREGAEAIVEPTDYLGLPAVRKTRPEKTYRDRSLDQRLRRERLRTEVRLLRDARRAGVRTPVVLDIDLAEMSIVLERLCGPTLTEVLQGSDAKDPLRTRAVERWGGALGRLHAAGISHGDLTASNVLWQGDDVAFLDLSLGSRAPGLEELGVDLHLVEEDLNTLCEDRTRLFHAFVEAYRGAYPSGAEAALARAREIRGRIRYA